MLKYIVLEVQTNADGTVGNLINTYIDKNQAESQFHRVLMSAAVSSLPRHTAFLLRNDGSVLRSESYEHQIEPTPDPESEVEE